MGVGWGGWGLAYVGWHGLAGKPGVELVGCAVIVGHAPEGAGEEVHGEEYDGEQARDLRCDRQGIGRILAQLPN